MPDSVDQTHLFMGFLDTLAPEGVCGWVVDLLRPSTPVMVEMLVDGVPVAKAAASQQRPDVRDAGMTAVDVGFTFQIPYALFDGQPHRVSLRTGAGEKLPLDDKDQLGRTEWTFCFGPQLRPAGMADPQAGAGMRAADSRQIHGNIDKLNANGIEGWAIEPQAEAPVELDLLIDGMPVAHIRCDQPRPDVQLAGERRSAVGFALEIPDRFHDGATHELQFQTDDGFAVYLGDDTKSRRNAWRFSFPAVGLRGQVDGMADGAIRGWVFSTNRQTGRRTGGLDVLVTCAGQPVAQVRADLFRGDVSARYGCAPNCGFLFVPPVRPASGHAAEYRFSVLGHSLFELEGSPVQAAFPQTELVLRLQDMLGSVESLFTQTWHLRQQIKSLIPATPHSLHHYHDWAVRYLDALARRHAGTEPALVPTSAREPLVSVICPVFRPRLADFIAAIRSVQAQTYRNWELLIVDDASASGELSAVLDDLAQSDSRTACRVLPQNAGISAATNAALEMARGDYIAFFDHDDLLVPQALEIMVAAALRSGGRLLYSDEDKIDDHGRFSEPHFKPAWNHRLLLAQNYICHLLFVERRLLDSVGRLDGRYDGAQDHELILRLVEAVSPAEIVHVPEILYHWRKTPTSTASAYGAKAYAVDAGARAIGDHLARRSLQARVHSRLDATLYDVEWQFAARPPVSIIIPYRDQAAMTRRCVEAILKLTAYPDFEIVLVDNFSTSDQACVLADDLAGHPQIRRLRINEAFNYSRLNNLAVAQTASPLLVFMNNDVVVQGSDWLQVLVDEALADPAVGVVGAKLLYPSGHVQHGGVVLGVGGIADHAHRGLGRDEPGYMARAISAHEISAVTAACMLCRREAYDAAGGFDEADLQVAFNDIDLCLRVRTQGYKVVMAPRCVAEHHESLSRGSDLAAGHQSRFFHENHVMATRWKAAIAEDPFYSRHFSRSTGIYRDLQPPDEPVTA